MKLVFLSAVCGVGKSTACDYIKNNNLLDEYAIFDIDDLENINDYNNHTYNVFYENAIKNAIVQSNNKNIIIGSCINPNDIQKLNIPKSINSIELILLTCSSDELEKRLRARDESRNCGSDEFIKGQIDYQNYMLNHLNLYKLHLDNTNCEAKDIAKQIVDYLNSDK